jgi:hypothetical protein
MGQVGYLTVTIANGAAVSSAVNTQNRRVLGIITPAAWTAADIVWEMNDGAGNFRSVRSSTPATKGNKIVAPPVAEAIAIMLAMTTTPMFGNIRIRSVSAADDTADANQGALRTLIILVGDM